MLLAGTYFDMRWHCYCDRNCALTALQLCSPILEAKDCALRLDKTGDHRLVLILDSETDRDAWIDAINFEA